MTKQTSSTPISSFKHQDKRVNIPPAELSAFLEDEEKQPKTMLYPRDPSLDPQLVWRGKDEQDRKALEVPTVPIYIQEKIQPQAIIENVRKAAVKSGKLGEKAEVYNLNFFADFNNIKFEDLVEFYEHEQNWTNRMVLGDSLLVMTSLAEKEGLKGRVQMIYMDPPYGIKFGSNWQSRLRKREVKDGAEADLTREPEQVKAFRDTWELGIHTYLSYLRDRLTIAREMLTHSGSIFIQISDQNIHLVRCILDEVFGSENQCATIIWKKGTPDSSTIRNSFNYLLWYMKDSTQGTQKVKNMFDERRGDEGTTEDPKKLALWGIFPDEERPLTTEEKRSILNTKRIADVFRVDKVIEGGIDPEREFNFVFKGKKYLPGNGRVWRGKPAQMYRLSKAERIIATKEGFGFRFFIKDFPIIEITNLWEDTAGNIKDMHYVVETNPKIIERCVLMTTDPGDLVLDPTCGGGTTAYVAEQWGRRWITVDTSRVAVALARMRLMTARYPYYLLADSAEGRRKELDLTPAPLLEGEGRKSENDLRMGFVYQRVPHITLKSIANNEEIDTIYAKWQDEMDPLRGKVNKALGKRWEEWEMPRGENSEIAALPAVARNDIVKWWEMRRGRQKEIDASIAKRADMELLYDKPYEDNKRIRVCGPFTVESLSPHRVLATDVERTAGEKEAERMESGGKFEQRIIENLRTAGVQNTKKGERLEFTRLEQFAGGYLQASGEYVESGKTKRAAVCIGPEHGTVGPDLIREAAKEAMQGVGFDLLVVLGFAFDASISEEVKKFGKLMVLPARINPDLMMGDLLKKTKAANLFTVFGEPDIEVKTIGEKLQVKLKGVDIFDPTTGEIRSSDVKDIACWFVDTDYNGESFFVKQAYFTGWDEPYEKLRRALKAEVDEGAWQALYQTESILFDKPKGGSIAVKVINDYGDEVMKVYKL